jgi:hypothetical protein
MNLINAQLIKKLNRLNINYKLLKNLNLFIVMFVKSNIHYRTIKNNINIIP